MATSNLDRLIVSTLHHLRCNSSSSSQTSYATNNNDSHEDQNVKLVAGALKLQVPSSSGEFKVSNGEDDPKTPRSKEHRIPVTAICPPAPRKARRVSVTGKRKPTGPFFPVVGVAGDFIVYVPDIVVGDLGIKGHHAKKLKLLPSSAQDL